MTEMELATKQHEQHLRFRIVETVLAHNPQIDTHDLLIKSSAIAGWVINDVLSVVQEWPDCIA